MHGAPRMSLKILQGYTLRAFERGGRPRVHRVERQAITVSVGIWRERFAHCRLVAFGRVALVKRLIWLGVAHGSALPSSPCWHL